jgi:hypothetical protein
MARDRNFNTEQVLKLIEFVTSMIMCCELILRYRVNYFNCMT